MIHENEANNERDSRPFSRNNKISTKLEESSVNNNTYGGASNSNNEELQACSSKSKYLLGVELNNGINQTNLIGAYVCSFTSMMIIEITATMIIFILQDPDYFGMTSKEAGKQYGDIVFYTHLFIIFCSDIPTGFLIELLGRRLVIVSGILLGSISMFMLQFPKEIIYLYFIRFGMALSAIPLLVSPLIPDYCKTKNRGLANGFSMVIGIFGLVAVTKLIPFVYNGYGVPETCITFSIIIFLSAVTIFLLIRNPPKSQTESEENENKENGENQDLKEASMTSVERIVLIDNFSSPIKNERNNDYQHLDESLSKRRRIILMIKLLCSEIRDKPEILVCYWTYFFIRAFNNLSTSFYTAWVGSFFNQTKEGHRDSISTANNILFWSNIVSIPLNVCFGYLSDRIKFKMIFPITTICIGVGCGLILLAKEPYDVAGFAGEILLLCSGSIHSLMNVSLNLKLVGTKIRGPIIAVGVFCGSIGFTTSGKLLGFLISHNSNWPFIFGLCY